MIRGPVFVSALVGLILAGLGYAAWNFKYRQSGVQIDVQIKNTRTLGTGPELTALVADVDIRNTSNNTEFKLREVRTVAEFSLDNTTQADYISFRDAADFLASYPQLQSPGRPPLRTAEALAPGQSVQRQLVVKFDLPEAKVKERKALIVLLRDWDNKIFLTKAQ